MTIEKLAARNLPSRNVTIRSIIGGEFNLPQVDWKRNAEKREDFRRL